MRGKIAVLLLAAAAGCSDDTSTTATTQALSPTLKHGRDTWFNATFGGEKFFTNILPAAPFNLRLGLDLALTSPRATRFNNWGLINDPGCVQGDASTGYLDKCDDPESAGVIGVRKKVVVEGGVPKVLIGVSCASCHAGFDPTNPPVNPNAPTWDNIHPTTGNQYINIAKLFGAHLSTHDPRWQVFNTWAPGTVDTTAIENDGINNPGIITQFFSTPDRPYFELTDAGNPIYVHRGGQGGEDDVGCEKAALRVYFNIGMCAAECMVPHLHNGPGGTQTEIDDAECSAACPEYVQAKQEVGTMCDFMAAASKNPRLADAPGGADHIDTAVLDQGKQVFEANCAGCHSNGQPPGHDVLSDDLLHPMAEIGTNSCRARSTNWMEGQIWGQFSSDQYKARPTSGPGFYRDVPLLGIWATAPFFHNNRLGSYNGDPSVTGRLAAYEDAMDQLLNPTHRNLVASIQRNTTFVCLDPLCGAQIPAGVPVALWANGGRCNDVFENQGHLYGATLSDADKYALKEWLKTK